MSQLFETWGRLPPNLKTVDLHFGHRQPMEPYARDATFWEKCAQSLEVVLTRHEHPSGARSWPAPVGFFDDTDDEEFDALDY